jgi:FAD-linked oxidoreductase
MLGRREILKAFATASVLGAGGVMSPAASSRVIEWKNWSGSQSCVPRARVAPATLGELQQFVADSAGPIRPVGAGHSFTPLVPTDGDIVSLARISGIVDHDPATLQATFHAGTQLSGLGEPLHEVGQALVNMPDIDEQVLAGAIATGTHGTGAGIGGLPSFVTGVELVTASGELISCDANHNAEVFEAARLSLGAVGILSKVRLQNTTPYRSRRESWIMDWDETLEQAQTLAATHRNFEFYYIPFSDRCFLHTHDLTQEEKYATPMSDPNESVLDLKLIRDYLSWSDTVRGWPIQAIGATMDREVQVEASWLNYASERNVRFNEMEYHLPRESGLQALREVRELLERDHKAVFFPIEVRFVKNDDVWLSPFYQRDSMSIAVHRFYEEDYLPYFKAIEPIFRKYGGRPHWGKLNTVSGAEFAELYPRWGDFLEVRQQLDPDGKFLNTYLTSLFVDA